MACKGCGDKKRAAEVARMTQPVEFASINRPTIHRLIRDNIEKGKYRNDIGAFKLDILSGYGLTKHPKADLAFSIAWERGNANGHYEVLLEFDQLSYLLIQ